MLFRKTPASKREVYRFHSVTGEVFKITADEVGEENVRLLYSAEDAEVYNNVKNSRPKMEEWQKAGIEKWKEQHPGEEVPKNWNLSMDGLEQTEDADHSSYMKEIYNKTTEDGRDSQRDLLRDMVSELPEEDQVLYRMFHIEEQSQQSIGEYFGVSQTMIIKRVKKLEKKLIEMCRAELKK